MIVAGVGLRREAASSAIVALIEAALERAGLDRSALEAIATARSLEALPALAEAAALLGVPIRGLDREALRAGDVRTVTRSSWALNTHGVGSVAEAAALAAAGPGGTLVLPRIAAESVTCALARSA